MNPEELFKIQSQQVLEEIKKIDWIAQNSEKLKEALLLEIRNKNAEFSLGLREASNIFRGIDIQAFIINYVRGEMA
jgi:hypothetical protein